MARQEEWKELQRKEIAARTGALPYTIMSNSAIEIISKHRPTSLDALKSIPGVGEARAKNFGVEMITAIAGCLEAQQVPDGLLDGLDADDFFDDLLRHSVRILKETY